MEYEKGDFYVIFKIVVPLNTSARQAEIFKELRALANEWLAIFIPQRVIFPLHILFKFYIILDVALIVKNFIISLSDVFCLKYNVLYIIIYLYV